MKKHKTLKNLTAFILTILLTIMFIPTQYIYAADGGPYDGSGTGSEGVSGGYIEGASASKQAVRVYVIKEDGTAITQAVDLFFGAQPSSNYYNGQDFGYAVTKLVDLSHISSITKGTVPSGMPTPFKYTGGSFIGNGSALNTWAMTPNGEGALNIDELIFDVWGQDILDLFKDKSEVYYLCLEPIVWHGIYVGKTYTGKNFYGTAKDWMLLYMDLGIGTNTYMKSLDCAILQTCMMLEYPILGQDTNFTLYSNITQSVVQTTGYGVHVYSNQLGGQTTADEPQMPTPHASAQESNGKCKIVKTYRIKDSNNNYQDAGTYVREEVDGNIQIENETGWNVVGWASSRTFNSNPGYNPWAPPQELGTGKIAQNVKVPTGGTLYVLLEKVEEEEEELGDYDYIISQSRITKKISMSAPVSSNGTLKGILDKEFKWSIAAHPECQGHHCHGCGCPGHYETCDACGGSGGTDEDPCGSCGGSGEVEVDCPLNGKCTCVTTHYCHEYEYDTSWDGDQQLTLSLDNYLQSDYQDILVPQDSEEWNVETREAEGTEKGFYNDEFSIDREVATESEEWEESGWDYTCVIMRGKDKLTLAEWINNGEGNQEANEANADLGDISEAGFYVADTPQGTRKVHDYDDNFRVYISIDKNHGYDIHSTWKPSKTNPITECRCGGCRPSPSTCTTKKYASSNSWESGTIKVRVEVYSGSSDGGTNDTSYNANEMIIPSTRLSGYNTTSGRMVQGKTITFYPYIEMQYDKVVEEGLPAFVLSQFSRQITVNDFAEINWNKQGSENLTIFSNQWSTYAQAKEDKGVEKVIPGGAELDAEIKDNDRQIVNVTTYQVILDGTGLTQVEKTGSYDPSQTMSSAQGEHAAYVSSVVQGLEATSIIQYASDDDTDMRNVWEFGDKVYPDSSLSCIGSTLRASTEDKYYFRDEGSLGEAQQGDFDVENLGTESHTYTFYTTTSGEIKCSKDNTSPKNGENNASAFERQLINERTGVEDKLSLGLEHGTGNDSEAKTGTTWYNEAFDGITIVVQSTNLRAGYLYPTKRINVIDPKLCPVSEGQADNLTEYNVSQYRTKNYSAAYGEPYMMGQFKTENVKMVDLDNFFWSRKFYIPNYTAQDRHG